MTALLAQPPIIANTFVFHHHYTVLYIQHELLTMKPMNLLWFSTNAPKLAYGNAGWAGGREGSWDPPLRPWPTLACNVIKATLVFNKWRKDSIQPEMWHVDRFFDWIIVATNRIMYFLTAAIQPSVSNIYRVTVLRVTVLLRDLEACLHYVTIVAFRFYLLTNDVAE